MSDKEQLEIDDQKQTRFKELGYLVQAYLRKYVL